MPSQVANVEQGYRIYAVENRKWKRNNTNAAAAVASLQTGRRVTVQ